MTQRARGIQSVGAPRRTVAVVGGGVTGLTTAIALAEQGHDVHVLTGLPSQQTTSSVAAAFWYPFAVNGYVKAWAASAYYVLNTLSKNGHARSGSEPAPGVHIAPAVEYLDTHNEAGAIAYVKTLWWRTLPGIEFSFRGPGEDPLVGRVTDFGEADSLGSVRFAAAVYFRTPVINMPVYLDYLAARLLQLGGTIRRHHWVERLRPLLDRGGYDAVINCAGYASESFARDTPQANLRPVMGQVQTIRMPAKRPAEAEQKLVFLHTGRFENQPVYVVPRTPQNAGQEREVILGGSLDPLKHYDGRAGLPPADPALESVIARRCRVVAPALRSLPAASNLESRVGLRPTADQVQVGKVPRTKHAIFSNYGHGGGGVSLSWGCAYSVAEQVERWFKSRG